MKTDELKKLIESKKDFETLDIEFSLETAHSFSILSKELRRFYSSAVVVQINGKKFVVSDPYLNTSINLKEFPGLISNTLHIAKRSGIKSPKAAVLSAVEMVNLNMESSVYGAVAEAMGKRGQLGKNVFVEGPLSMDVALSEKAAKEKKVFTEVAGNSNVLVCHRGSIARGIVEGLKFLGVASIETFITDGESVFRVI